MKKSSVRFDTKIGDYRIDFYQDGYRHYDYSAWWLVAQFKKFWFLYIRR
jgi:hypothetical protein